jgi:hypothetical protein
MEIKKIFDTLTSTMLIERFNKEVNKSHIEYDWDAGHCYSYIKHPIYDLILDSGDQAADEHATKWLYENDECPPCCINLNKDGTVSSSCGCHDGLTDPQRIKDIVEELEDIQKKTGISFLVTRD